jgi:hypothetical protein
MIRNSENNKDLRDILRERDIYKRALGLAVGYILPTWYTKDPQDIDNQCCSEDYHLQILTPQI